MALNRKSALITDFDNTLFDWVELWVGCFAPMLAELSRISGISIEALKPEIKAIHQRHGTSEYSFLIEEMPSFRKFGARTELMRMFEPAINLYREERRKRLLLFPTVADTLLKIKGAGALIVTYTESMGFYSNYRLRRLGLDGVVDTIFCPQDHDLPNGMTAEQIRKYPAEHYDLRYTNQQHTPKGSKKPDHEVLDAIIGTLGLEKHQCVYVGDSLVKDVAMAQDCGVDDVWAKFGEAHRRPEYSLLVDVTHWTEADVKREQQTRERSVSPSCVLESSFSELLDHFEFRDSHAR